jgi:hypothetical protein
MSIRKGGSLAIGCLLFLALFAGQCLAQDENEQESAIMESRHRLDFSIAYLDTFLDDALSGAIGYTYSLTSNTNIGGSISYLDSRFAEDGGAGIGDTTLTFSWAPRVAISVQPWVPRRVGTGLSVILSTGDPSDGRSLDANVIVPFLGLVFPVTESFTIYPSLSYYRSLDKIVTGNHLNIGVADLGVGWVSSKGIWVNVYVALVQDFEIDDGYLNTAISVGMAFSERWGASIAYGDTNYFVPGAEPGIAGQINHETSLNLHYNF